MQPSFGGSVPETSDVDPTFRLATVFGLVECDSAVPRLVRHPRDHFQHPELLERWRPSVHGVERQEQQTFSNAVGPTRTSAFVFRSSTQFLGGEE